MSMIAFPMLPAIINSVTALKINTNTVESSRDRATCPFFEVLDSFVSRVFGFVVVRLCHRLPLAPATQLLDYHGGQRFNRLHMLLSTQPLLTKMISKVIHGKPDDQ